MKKWIFSISFFLTTSLAQSQMQMMIEHDHDHAPQSFKSHESRYIAPYTVSAGYLSVKGEKIEGFDNLSIAKLEKSFEVLEQVVNSEEFKSRIINFKNSKGERAFASNKNLSNEEIYAFFMEGRETLQQNTPGEMNFYLKLYHKQYSKVIGWTNGNINTININWKFFKNFKPNEVAGNLAHEWTHKLGFDHQSAAEHDSAPYAIGYIVREMGERYLKGEELH
jgi:hypothetical protein